MGLHLRTGVFQQLKQGLGRLLAAIQVGLQQKRLGTADLGYPGRHTHGNAAGSGFSRDAQDPLFGTDQDQGMV